jgi:hypothetical protein
LPFRTSRCFRNEFRRVLLAFAARVLSAVVGFTLGFDGFPLVVTGITGVDAAEGCLVGCIFIGPVVGVFADI